MDAQKAVWHDFFDTVGKSVVMRLKMTASEANRRNEVLREYGGICQWVKVTAREVMP